MKTENNIKKINLSAIEEINKYVKTTSHNHENKEIEQKITFSGYYDLIYSLNGLLKGINILSVDSMREESTNLDVIYTLSEFAMKIIPFQELEFLDNLLFKKEYENQDEFISIESFKKTV